MIKHDNNVANISSNNAINKYSKHNKLFGLWIYLMSDCVIFAVLFAVYAIISLNVDISIISNKIFNLSSVLLETCCLLLSSFSCGLIVISMHQKNIKTLYFYLIVTFSLGLIFLFLEIYEFYQLVLDNLGPDKHALLSIFFALVGMHGMHVFLGLILILSIIYQITKLGLTDTINTRILCLSVFWHFLDIIWICVFTFVYLSGCV